MSAARSTAWDPAFSILEQLRKAGYTALLAGGCVRDKMLGREPKDYDIATNALPPRVRELFPKSRLVGVKFGVVLVHRLGHDIEVTTFRSDGVYSDGRHPDEVIFGDEKADALRRDFTINGLFYDPIDDRVIDYVGGQADLHAGIIRTIGDPDARFAEDHLRMLRAVRLSARLNFSVEPNTALAMQRLGQYLTTISPERIWMELEQILAEPTRGMAWRLLCSLGLRPYVSPDWPADPAADDLAGRRLDALPPIAIESGLALPAALPDLSSKAIEEICRSLRLSNDLIDQVCWLKDSLEAAHRGPVLELADFKMLRANKWWPLLLELLRADLIARNGDLDIYEQTKLRGDMMSQDHAAPPPLLTGDHLLALGFKPGPALGEVLRTVYRAQLNETINSHEDAVVLAQRIAEIKGP